MTAAPDCASGTGSAPGSSSIRCSWNSRNGGRNSSWPSMEVSGLSIGTPTASNSMVFSSSGTSTNFGVRPPRSTLSEDAMTSMPRPCR